MLCDNCKNQLKCYTLLTSGGRTMDITDCETCDKIIDVEY